MSWRVQSATRPSPLLGMSPCASWSARGAPLPGLRVWGPRPLIPLPPAHRPRARGPTSRFPSPGMVPPRALGCAVSLGDSYPSAGRSGAPILSPAVLGSLLPFEPAPRELQVHAMGLLIASAPLKLLLHLKKNAAPTPQARRQAPGGRKPAWRPLPCFTVQTWL